MTYQVKAKIDAPWHIYKYSKTQADDGPQFTEFDFFDTAGLTLDKGWTAAPEPTRKQEPAFPDIPFVEFHEDEVVWSQQLKVPADAKAGKVTLRCQIGYMICSDQNCSFPGQWTLPPADLTIVGGRPSSRRTRTRRRPAWCSARLDDPAPSERQARQEGQPGPDPKAVKFTTEFVPAEAKAGDTVQLKVTAKLDPGWHIFQYAKAGTTTARSRS